MYYTKSSPVGKFIILSVTKSPSGHHVFSTTAFLFISVIEKSNRLKTYIIIVAYMHIPVNINKNCDRLVTDSYPSQYMQHNTPLFTKVWVEMNTYPDTVRANKPKENLALP